MGKNALHVLKGINFNVKEGEFVSIMGSSGSGKSTLFSSIADQFNVGYFINSDEIEKEISSKGFINIEQFGLYLTQKDLDVFKQEPHTITLIEKALKEGHQIDVEIRENVIVDNI